MIGRIEKSSEPNQLGSSIWSSTPFVGGFALSASTTCLPRAST